MAEKLECPACKAIISDDGETVFKSSPRLSRAEKIEDELKTVKDELADVRKGLEDLKKPSPEKKKDPFWG